METSVEGAFDLQMPGGQSPAVDKKKRFLDIIRHHGVGEVPGSVEMIPPSLPELRKPSTTPGKRQ